MFRFNLSLIYYPINCVRFKLLKSFKLSNWKNRTICFMLLDS